jgi:hypothetical protein
LITANVVQAGSVPRGAASIATINAPAGTTLTTLRWAGTARRRDCRYALQIYADVPGGAPISIKMSSYTLASSIHEPRNKYVRKPGGYDRLTDVPYQELRRQFPLAANRVTCDASEYGEWQGGAQLADHGTNRYGDQNDNNFIHGSLLSRSLASVAGVNGVTLAVSDSEVRH